MNYETMIGLWVQEPEITSGMGFPAFEAQYIRGCSSELAVKLL